MTVELDEYDLHFVVALSICSLVERTLLENYIVSSLYLLALPPLSLSLSPALSYREPRSFVRRRSREQRSRENDTERACHRRRVGQSGPFSSPTTFALARESRTHFRNEICEIIAPTLPPTAPVSTGGIRGILKTTTAAAGP